jgi:hypothetical protein
MHSARARRERRVAQKGCNEEPARRRCEFEMQIPSQENPSVEAQPHAVNLLAALSSAAAGKVFLNFHFELSPATSSDVIS